jgi:addiction module HigA family antidote
MSLWNMDVGGITPGEILKEEYMDALELSQNALARAIGVTPRSVNEIVLGRRSITAPMSIRLGAYFRQSPRFWLNLQTECDIRKALRDEGQLTSGIIPMEAVAEDQGTYGTYGE